MKGTHVLKTKDQLSDYEREVLSYVYTAKFSSSARQIADFMTESDHTKPAKALSILLGMDLIDVNDINADSPKYFIQDGVIMNRCMYALDRKQPGTTLWAIMNPNKHYLDTGVAMGLDLWPYRPIDRLQVEGEVKRNDNGKAYLSYFNPSGLSSIIGKKVVITIEVQTS